MIIIFIFMFIKISFKINEVLLGESMNDEKTVFFLLGCLQFELIFQICAKWPITHLQLYQSAPKMELELHDNERYFNDFISRQTLLDPRNLKVDLDTFRHQYPNAAQQLIKNPTKYYKLAKDFLERALIGDQKPRFQSKIEHYKISFEGNLGANFVTPRGLGSKLANELVGIQGIITKMDIAKHQLEKSVHYCQKTKAFEVKQYPDPLNPEKDFQPNKTRFIKTQDDNNNPLTFEYGMSSFRNIQTVVIQELPEMAPPGLLPQSVTVVLQGDLVNAVKPGDRVQMIGIYKLIGGTQSKEKGIFKPYFLCLSVKQLSQVLHVGQLPPRIPFSESQTVSICSRSVAPSIYGHEQLKKAVLLMLLGGEEKNLENGTHLRGDINLLMVGDPGTAKSQILRWVLSTAELAIGTTGSGASGVGLTAAIVSSKQTGEKTLQAGAMVLADRGVVCIDEFDKMNQIDRVAVHEVMQQQTVTIAKAGMHCSLNARCSVIAAANPIYGQYQQNMPPTKNIGMPDSLLSRFDLVFIILDEKNAQKDRKIGERVCRNHRLAPKINESYNQFNEDDEYIIHPNENQIKNDQNIYEKNNIYQSDTKSKEILTQSFLRRYITHCKHNIHPQLTEDAINLLSHLWTLLRQEDFTSNTSNRVLPITIRSYETLIRLSTAHAKLHQTSEVKIRDCIEGFRLMVYSLHGDSHALDDKLREIMKKLGLNEVTNEKSEEIQNKALGKNTKGDKIKKQIGQNKKMEEESSKLVQKMSKIDINKDQREAEQVIKIAMGNTVIVQPPKELKAIVFKALTDLKNKGRHEKGSITLKQLRKNVPESISHVQIGQILQYLDSLGHIHYDATSEKIYT